MNWKRENSPLFLQIWSHLLILLCSVKAPHSHLQSIASKPIFLDLCEDENDLSVINTFAVYENFEKSRTHWHTTSCCFLFIIEFLSIWKQLKFFRTKEENEVISNSETVCTVKHPTNYFLIVDVTFQVLFHRNADNVPLDLFLLLPFTRRATD